MSHERSSGRVAVITGAGGGIGLAAAVEFARRGTTVVMVERDGDRLRAAERSVRDAAVAGAEVHSLELDVTSEREMEEMAVRTLASCGRVDVLVTSAGVLRAPGSGLKQLAETTPEEFDLVVDVNLKGTFLATRAVLPAMLQQKSGQIVHISSLSGLQGRAFDGPYCASKFAVHGFSESLAEEVTNNGIRVHTLFLDAVATTMWQQNGPVPMPADALPPERVADFIVYLVDLPGDCVVKNPVLAAFGGRRRRRRQE